MGVDFYPNTPYAGLRPAFGDYIKSRPEILFVILEIYVEGGRILPINVHGLPRLNQRTGQTKEPDNWDRPATPHAHGRYAIARVHGGHTVGAKPKSPQGDPGKPARGNVRGPPTGPRRCGPTNGRPYRKYPRRTAPRAKKSRACLIIRRGPGKRILRYPISPDRIPGRRPGLY